MAIQFLEGDCVARMHELPDKSINCCVTSPPYWGLRDYGVDGQIGLEANLTEFVAKLVEVFGEVRRVLRDDGTLWLNLGDSYNAYNGNAGPGSGFSHGAACDTERPTLASGHGLRTKTLKPKDLCGIPWRVAFALQADGWWLRSDIIWHKPNPMPESVTDRPTKAHEYLFLFAKSARYYYDAAAIASPLAAGTRTTYSSTRKSKGTDALGKVAADNWSRDVPVRAPRLRADGSEYGANARTVWSIVTKPYKGAHFATFPPRLIEPCILAGCPKDGVVLDPFGGAGTTGLVADRLGRDAILIELNPEYIEMARKRIVGDAPLFVEVL